MSDDELPREADVEQVSRRLHQSLKACRLMVANYRAMLAGVANDNDPVEGSRANSCTTSGIEEA